MSDSRTYVYYFVPFDGDTEEHPNVFLIDKPVGELQIKDLYENFPLPGTYFFRFKQSFGKTYVWIDVQDVNRRPPLYNGKIFCKVTRESVSGGSLSSRPAASAAHTAHSSSVPPKPSVARRSPAAAPTVSTNSAGGTSAPRQSSTPVQHRSGPPAVSSSSRGGGGGGGGSDHGDLLGLSGDDGSRQQYEDADPFAQHTTPAHQGFQSSPVHSHSPAGGLGGFGGY